MVKSMDMHKTQIMHYKFDALYEKNKNAYFIHRKIDSSAWVVSKR